MPIFSIFSDALTSCMGDELTRTYVAPSLTKSYLLSCSITVPGPLQYSESIFYKVFDHQPEKL